MNLVTDILNQLATAPVGVLIVVAIIVAGYVWKASGLPNRLIPISGLIVGVLGSLALGDISKCPETMRFPQVQLIMLGGVYWLLAWATHTQVLKRLGLDKKMFGEQAVEPEPPATTNPMDRETKL